MIDPQQHKEEPYMEQTLGKRIMQCRKALGLTQDQLAERLGVTAQAVSKWENDQSCPDITSLPKLAEIFGTTVDALLGREPVHQAEVISNIPETSEDRDYENGSLEFKWNAGRRSGLSLACFVLLVGILSLANALLSWEVGFWDLTWPSALLVFGFFGLIRKFSFFNLGCTLFGGYFLLSNLNIWHLPGEKNILLPAILLLLGISLLVDALRRPKKDRFRVIHNGKHIGSDKEAKSEYRVDGQRFECSQAFGDSRRAVSLTPLAGGEIHCSFSDFTVDFTGCQEVAQGCQLDAHCAFGSLTLLIPRQFRVEPDSSTAFASLEFSGQPDPEPAGTIYLDASISFGSIEVHYV